MPENFLSGERSELFENGRLTEDEVDDIGDDGGDKPGERVIRKRCRYLQTIQKYR